MTCVRIGVKGRIRKMKEKKKPGTIEKKLLAACIFLTAAGVLTVCARQIPGFAEWYSVHIYKVLTAVFGRVTGISPFSIVEFGLYALLVWIPVSGIWMIIKAVRSQQGGAAALCWVSGLFLTASVLLFLYTINCGINYQRESFSEKSGLLAEQYTTEELKNTCEWLTKEVNARAAWVKRNAKGEMILGSRDAAEKEEVREQQKGAGGEMDVQSPVDAAVFAMERLAEEYPDIKGYYPRPKPVCVSEILSYQGLTGVYSPFTVEANYNADMPDYNIPFTLCHELSHLRGFMQEEEANFIAFLACSGSERKDFQYSGYLLAWSYSMSALRRSAAEEWQEVRAGLDEQIEADLRQNSLFWDSYDGKVAEVSDIVNDTYLKVNGQSDGVKSYGKMVDLIIAYAQKENTGLSR